MRRLDDFAPDLAVRHHTNPLFSVKRQGNFTLAVLYDDFGSPMSFGIAKRNLIDEDRPIHAARLALSRAIRRGKVWFNGVA